MRAYWLAFLLLGAASCSDVKAVPCTQPSDCGGTLLCDTTHGGICVPCSMYPTPNGEQGGCAVLSDGKAPFCDTGTNKCRVCQADSECPDSQVCSSSDRAVLNLSVPMGQCVPKAQVAYVNNANCAGGGGSGTMASPFCDPQTALSSGRSYLVLAAASNPYPSFTVGSGAVAALGAVQDSMPGAQVAGITVTGTGTLAMDGITVTTRANTDTAANLLCNSPTASLVVYRSAIEAGVHGGIESNPCMSLTVERSRVNLNTGVGINLGGGTKYQIQNSLFSDQPANGSNDAAILMDPTVMPIQNTDGFSFNTVVNNHGGISCQGQTLSSSIIVTNSPGMITQFLGSCILTNVVVGPNDMVSSSGMNMNVIKASPTFMGGDAPGGYKLTNVPANTACCLDQLTSGPAVDYFGTSRPQNNKWDIGFHELVQ